MAFSSLQKFSPGAEEESFPCLSGRKNIIVIADEAHRSQYGFEAVLVEQLQQNVTADWHLKESARAKLHILVRRILKKYDYPPDLAPVAINTVLSQAETLLQWSAAH